MVVKGVAYDTPIPGYRNRVTDLLRLWKAEAVESFDFADFNVGDYYGAVQEKVLSENITKVLYPNDEPEGGKLLRLAQQYFFVSCSLQDMIRIHLLQEKDLDSFHERFAIQLNDTHPSIAVAELMRLLVDDHDMDWEQAWEITRTPLPIPTTRCCRRRWRNGRCLSLSDFLPRHLEIIYEINRRFLDEVRLSYPRTMTDLQAGCPSSMKAGKNHVRMANLAAWAVMPSTGWPPFIPNSSKPACSGLPDCGRRSSST